MGIEHKVVEKEIQSLTKKADEAFDSAKIQHEIADEQAEISAKQHAVAEKMVNLGQALEGEAVTLKGELEMDAQRPGHRPPAETAPATDSSSPKRK